MKGLTSTYKLSNGYEIPCIAYGTWQIPDGEITSSGVAKAIDVGYRHIDTAAIYQNEKSVGKGIKDAGIAREELFVTSKVWNKNRGYDKTMAAFEQSLSDLQMDYLDLYLIHWPAAAHQYNNWEDVNADTWRALMDLYKAGRVKAIGVCNFMPHHLKKLMEAEIKPMIDQIEFHPGQMQMDTVNFCRENGILVEAWSPLGTGKMLTNETLGEIAAKYGKSVAQLCIRWCLQNGTLPLPKTQTLSRIPENANVFDFEITQEDMEVINRMEYFGGSGFDPDQIGF